MMGAVHRNVDLFDDLCFILTSFFCVRLGVKYQVPNHHCFQHVTLHICSFCRYAAGVNMDETDHPELLMPPPAYDDAVDITLYPPTPQMQRNVS